jgi:hypothetical protein
VHICIFANRGGEEKSEPRSRQTTRHIRASLGMESKQGEPTLDSMKKARTVLEDAKIHVRFKMSALWASVMFCYIYADYFGLYVPGALQRMLQAKMGPLGSVTQGVLLGTSAMMAVPSVMIFLSLVLKPKVNRWLNIIFGAVFTLIILATMPGSWAFYIFFGIIEVVLTSLIVWYAWSWPKQEAA